MILGGNYYAGVKNCIFEENVSRVERMLKISTYSLKSHFQKLLMPMRDWLVFRHYTPNQITLATCCLCIVYSAFLVWSPTSEIFLILLPVFLLVRMALNALDGMVALHTKKQTAFGVVLNEVCDVISDLVLFGVFITILPIQGALWLALVFLNFLSEFVGLSVYQATGVRPFFGPFGKSDRAVFLGGLAIFFVFLPDAVLFFQVYVIIGILLSLITIANRLKMVIH